ncbi:hypothetical protein HK097_008085 [Rhizophlyctis rosea]|uniref:PUM-HD domain-containing protein n=1 Tax=Rhizophlyctis rosea TaxID=64517 RepID=A0AAD5X4S1_9FUNG|nr:hypothetical protein HK097_008085 [Rhizophlyctis rosea]
MPKGTVAKHDKPSAKSATNGKADRKPAAKPKPSKPEPVEEEEDWEDEDGDEVDEMEIDEDGDEGWDVEEEGEGGLDEEGEEGGDGESGEGGDEDGERPTKKTKTAEDLEKDRQSRAEQKKLLQERKAHKPNAGLIQRAKKLWEHLRQKKLKPEDRQKYMEELMGMVEGKAKDIIFKHDASRIVQCALKYGNQQQRDLIATELKGNYAEIAKAQYGRFIVSKVLNYCSPVHRNEVIQNFYGKVRKLIRHREAAIVLEEAYSQFANGAQRTALIEEFYGPEFALFKTGGSRTIDDLFTANPAKKPTILKALRQTLDSLLEKGTAQIGQISIVHRALYEYMSHADHKDVSDLIELLKEHLPHILHTREGARVAQLTILHAGPKDRKVIVKSFKGLVQRIAKEQYGHAVLLTVFECVDDTVLIQKAVLAELVKDGNGPGERFVDVLRDRYGSRVALYILCGRNKRYQPAYVVKELEESDEIRARTSKKDDTLRKQQLLEAFAPLLMGTIEKNAGELVRDKASGQVVLEAARRIKDNEGVLKAIATLAEGTVEEFAGKNKKPEKGDEPFNAVKQLKKEADQSKQTDEGLDMSEHVLVNRLATFVLKELVSGGRRGMDGESEGEEAGKVGDRFAGLLFEKVEPNVGYWLRRCAQDPRRSAGTAFVFESLLKSGNEGVSRGLVAAVRKEKGLVRELEKQIAEARKEEVVPKANGEAGKKNNKRKRKDAAAGSDGAEGKGDAARLTGIEMFLAQLAEAK